MKLPYFNHILIAGLACGCLFHPASSAVGLLFILGSKLAEIYLTSNISDEERLDIQVLKVEVQKMKAKTDQEGLGKAFARGNA